MGSRQLSHLRQSSHRPGRTDLDRSEWGVPTTKANAVELYYERDGAGPPLLFLNGSGATVENSAPLFAAFAGAFDLVAFDQRGLGRSAPASGPYTMADLAADVLGLADHLGWEHFRLAGISFGGMVAQELAVTTPERVRRLALLCTSPGGPDRASFPLQTLDEMDPAERVTASAQLLDTRFTPEWLDSHENDRALAALLGQRFTSPQSEEVRAGNRLQLLARSGHDVFERLPRITCPTFVASGRYDGIAPAANGTAIAAQIPDATLRLYEGGHLFLLQDPEAFPEIIAFLAAD
jgi:3-oxoadipate enol-lactonase